MNIAQRLKNEGKIEGKIEGRVEGKEEGREEGREETLQQIALKSLQLGFSADVISKITGFHAKQRGYPTYRNWVITNRCFFCAINNDTAHYQRQPPTTRAP